MPRGLNVFVAPLHNDNLVLRHEEMIAFEDVRVDHVPPSIWRFSGIREVRERPWRKDTFLVCESDGLSIVSSAVLSAPESA